MAWVRIDDGFFRHPKARAVGKDGRELTLASWCWSSANLTDGHIPAESLAQLLSDAEVRAATTERLVRARLWEPGDDGWTIHDFLKFNKSREYVLGRRERWATYKANYRNGERP